MRINVLESPTLYVSEQGFVDAVITPFNLIGNSKHLTSIERIICIFKCQHANAVNDADGVYCYDCNNHDMTDTQAEELQEAYEREHFSGKYDGDPSDEARNR